MSVRRGSAVQTNGLVTPTPYVSLAEVRENKPDTPVVTRFGLSINVRRETCNSSPSVFEVTRASHEKSDYGKGAVKRSLCREW